MAKKHKGAPYLVEAGLQRVGGVDYHIALQAACDELGKDLSDMLAEYYSLDFPLLAAGLEAVAQSLLQISGESGRELYKKMKETIEVIAIPAELADAGKDGGVET